MCKKIDVQAIKDDIILKAKYFDSGKLLGIAGTGLEKGIELLNPKKLKERAENLISEDTRLFVQSKVRLAMDVGSWAINRFQGIF